MTFLLDQDYWGYCPSSAALPSFMKPCLGVRSTAHRAACSFIELIPMNATVYSRRWKEGPKTKEQMNAIESIIGHLFLSL